MKFIRRSGIQSITSVMWSHDDIISLKRDSQLAIWNQGRESVQRSWYYLGKNDQFQQFYTNRLSCFKLLQKYSFRCIMCYMVDYVKKTVFQPILRPMSQSHHLVTHWKSYRYLLSNASVECVHRFIVSRCMSNVSKHNIKSRIFVFKGVSWSNELCVRANPQFGLCGCSGTNTRGFIEYCFA